MSAGTWPVSAVQSYHQQPWHQPARSWVVAQVLEVVWVRVVGVVAVEVEVVLV